VCEGNMVYRFILNSRKCVSKRKGKKKGDPLKLTRWISTKETGGGWEGKRQTYGVWGGRSQSGEESA